MKEYKTEREGQIEFFENYGIPWKENDEILANNTDGVYNGILMEFKLVINNINKTLLQAIKYLSRMRICGESVPEKILLVDLNNQIAYEFNSEDYRKEIQTVYIGAASKNNDGFSAGAPVNTYKYTEMVDSNDLKKTIKRKKEKPFMPIDIDESCIVGWAERYYRENPNASKGDFLGDENGVSVKIKGEIREPKYFKGEIREYKGETNEKFKYLMDCLNDNLSKKDLGAFYTPIPYAEKAAEMVVAAVNRAIDYGKSDYIVLDRCAGTGNLESALIGKKDKNGDDIISHCVVSTFEYYEYKVLNERIGDVVRDILPPTEGDVIYSNGKIVNADAMSKDFIENKIVKRYVGDDSCAIIMFENPPYRDQSQKNNDNTTKRERTDRNFVREEMKKTKRFGLAVNDILNLFVWSAYEYYIRDEADSYILFAPIKHWKRVGLSDKKVENGYIFNRKYFHASPEAISCIHFSNIDVNDESITLHALDIEGEKTVNVKDVVVKKSHEPMSKLFDKRKFEDDDNEKAICCERSGEETFRNCRFSPYYNDNMIGYIRAESYGFDANSVCFVRNALYNGNGFYLRKDRILEGLPLFVAKQYKPDEWYMKNMVDTTSDLGHKYEEDDDFKKACLIYSCLSNQNKCLTFDGSDGRHYQNEVCFDNGTLASELIEKMDLDNEEKELMECWRKVYESAKATGNLKDGWKYGVYQISKEINTFKKKQDGRKTTIVYDYPELNGNLETLRVKLKKYYTSHIVKKMFDYELLK